MKVEFLDPAETEFVNAIMYYNGESEGLGYEFAAEVNRTIGRMVEFPNAWASLSKRTRRCRTSRFPYGIVCQLLGDDSKRTPERVGGGHSPDQIANLSGNSASAGIAISAQLGPVFPEPASSPSDHQER